MLRTDGVAAASPDQQASDFNALFAAMLGVNEEQIRPELEQITLSTRIPATTVEDRSAGLPPTISDAPLVGTSLPWFAGREATEAAADPAPAKASSSTIRAVDPSDAVSAVVEPPEIAFMGGASHSLDDVERAPEIARIFNEDGLFPGRVGLGAQSVSIQAKPSFPRTVAEALHVGQSAPRMDPMAFDSRQVSQPNDVNFVGLQKSAAEQASVATSTVALRDPRMQSSAMPPAATGRPGHAQPPFDRMDLRSIDRNCGGERFGAQRLTARILDLLREVRMSDAEVTMEFAGEDVRVFVRATMVTREERLRLRSAIERLAADHGRRLIEIVCNGEQLLGGGA